MLNRYSTAGDLGLRTLADPPDAIVDIIFVHGLTGNRDNTWTWVSGDRKVYWPQAFLPKDLPQARISTFGYDADVVRLWKTASSNTLRDHGKALAEDISLRRERTDTEFRPLIFVAHSLGGLVVEQALLICRGSNESYLMNLLHCIAGIVFLGTPHVGSDLASWAKILTHLANVLRKANREIVAVLQPGSESLANLQQEFHTMIEPLKIVKNSMRLYCFYEEIAVAGVGEIVPKHSAILASYPNRGIHANHMDMTKFSSPQDSGYIAVSGQLWRWVKEVKAGLKAREEVVEEEARASRAPPLPSQRLLLHSQPSGEPSSAGIVSTGGNATFNDNFVVGNWNPGK